MPNYDANDCDWTWDGDYIRGDDGDIADTSDDLIRSLENEIRTVIKSEFGDWEFHKLLGSNITDFLGEPNTRETGQRIEERIVSSMDSAGVVRGSDLKVRVMPVSSSAVFIVLKVQAEATSGNRLEVGEPIVVSLIYDSLEDSVFFLPPDQIAKQAI